MRREKFRTGSSSGQGEIQGRE